MTGDKKGWLAPILCLNWGCPHLPFTSSTWGSQAGLPMKCLVLRRHTSRFLLVWLIMLPFTLWAAYSWTSIFLSGIFGFLMLGIDEIGVSVAGAWCGLAALDAGMLVTMSGQQLAAT